MPLLAKIIREGYSVTQNIDCLDEDTIRQSRSHFQEMVSRKIIQTPSYEADAGL